MTTQTRSRGFTLIETLIVLAVVTVIGTVMSMWLSSKMSSDSRDSYISAEANDLALLASAVTKYIATPPATWTTQGTPYPILVTDLIAANDLPASFANRNNTIGTSPFFQSYSITAEVDASDSKPRVLIRDLGAISAARLERIGAANTVNGVQALKQSIVDAASKKFTLAAGTIAPNTTVIVVGNGNAWTKDLSAWATPDAAKGADAAVLIGYPDLSGTGTDPTGKWGYCNFYHPVGAPNCVANGGVCQPAQCPAGWTSLVTNLPYCGNSNIYVTPHYAVYPSDVGDVILSQEKVDDGAHWWITGYSAVSGYASPQPQYTMYDDYHYDNDISLNGKQVDSDKKCYFRKYVQGYDLKDGYGCQIGNPAAPPSLRTPCVYTEGYATDRPPAIDQLTTQALDLLCCQPK